LLIVEEFLERASSIRQEVDCKESLIELTESGCSGFGAGPSVSYPGLSLPMMYPANSGDFADEIDLGADSHLLLVTTTI
jgi:hypothetical protein